MQRLSNSLYVIFTMLTLSCNCVGAAEIDFKANILDFYPGNFPKRIVLSITNNSSNKLSIYEPHECFHFFWSAMLVNKGSISQEYLIRSDIPWKEPTKKILHKGEKFSDTVVLVPNSFYKKDCQEGCTPFRKSAKVSFKYEFKGMATIQANTRGVFIPDSTAVTKDKITTGTWSTNEVTFPAIDFDKLQASFTEENFGVPLISIKENCCQ